MRAALRDDVPMVGVCRGAQLLSVLFGGDLEQHIDGHAGDRPHAVRRPSRARRSAARSAPGPTVVSDHHQAVRRLGRGLRVTATAPDGVPEAIEVPGRRLALGLQWHPERGRRRAHSPRRSSPRPRLSRRGERRPAGRLRGPRGRDGSVARCSSSCSRRSGARASSASRCSARTGRRCTSRSAASGSARCSSSALLAVRRTPLPRGRVLWGHLAVVAAAHERASRSRCSRTARRRSPRSSPACGTRRRR